MAIATDIEVNWINTIDSSNKIGLSKPLNQLSVNIFDDAEFCLGYQNKAFKLTKETATYPHSTDAGADNVPFFLLNNVGYTLNSFNNPDGVYYRTILLAVPNGFSWGWETNLRSDNSQVRIVTKLDLQKNKLYLTTDETTKSALTTTDFYTVNESLSGTGAYGNFEIGVDVYHIRCADIYQTENGYYIKFQTFTDNMYDNFNPTYGEGVSVNFNYDIDSSMMLSVSPVWFANSGWVIAINGSGNPNTYYIQDWHDTELDTVPDADNPDIKFFASYSLYSPYYWRTYLHYSVEYALWIAASYGLLFEWNGTPYKPVIEYGALKGYTDDMSTPSDIDNWSDVTGHNISPVPPVPPSPGDDEDEDTAITTNGAPFGTGLAHYYVTTVDSVTLQHISEAMSTWDIDTSKKDLYKNLISCKIIKPPAGIPSTSGVFTIYGVKPQYNGADITIPEVTGNPSITFGPYSISRKFNDFRDYAPYSKAEIFIPYCGWTALPSHVIGRSVYVDYFTDVIAGTVKAVIRCGNNAVAEAAGVMAVDVPFAAQNVGAKVAAATTGMLSYGQGALQASVGIGQSVASKGKSGIKNITSGLASVIGAYNQMAMVNNENWTEINGKSGDGCALAGIDTIIIKITRPKYGSYTAPYYVPADYGHTVGFVSMKKTTVGSCTGLIICDNVDTSGISGATDRERQLIKEYLESGVIVRHPE